MSMHLFKSYSEWHHAITERCGLTLDRNYCADRIKALGNDSDRSTRAFLDSYGSAYRDQVVAWFQQALREA